MLAESYRARPTSRTFSADSVSAVSANEFPVGRSAAGTAYRDQPRDIVLRRVRSPSAVRLQSYLLGPTQVDVNLGGDVGSVDHVLVVEIQLDPEHVWLRMLDGSCWRVSRSCVWTRPVTSSGIGWTPSHLFQGGRSFLFAIPWVFGCPIRRQLSAGLK